MRPGRGPAARAVALAGVLAGKGAALADVRQWPLAFGRWIGACVREEIEFRRLFLWLPVFFGAGVLVYFSASREPVLAAVFIALGLTGLASSVLWRRERLAGARWALAAFSLCAGFAAGCVKTALVDAAVLGRTLVASTTAYVQTIDHRANGARLVLRPQAIEGLSASELPRRIRVTMRWRPDFTAGTSITATMRLLPPPVAAEPGGYDFPRDAFFMGVGAVDNIVSRPANAAGEAPAIARFTAWRLDRPWPKLAHREDRQRRRRDERRGRGGAGHWQARNDPGRGKRRSAGGGHLPYSFDIGPAHDACRGSFRLGPAGAVCPVSGACAVAADQGLGGGSGHGGGNGLLHILRG